MNQILYLIVKRIFLLCAPPIALTYDAYSKQDGLGAQTQRILAIHSLSVNLRVSYIHAGIVDMAVHPLDSLNSRDDVEAFLGKVNQCFYIEPTQKRSFVNAKTYSVSRLTNFQLLLFFAKSFFLRNSIILEIVEPYGCSDLFPVMYKSAFESLLNLGLEPSIKTTIGIHYRRGFGNFDIQKGEGLSREVEVSKIVRKCNEIVEGNPDISSVYIFTDAVPNDSIFTPPLHQKGLWINNINFDGKDLISAGIDLNSNFSNLKVPFTVISGGDPLESLLSLAHFDTLILSRSSFGYVSALLALRKEVWLPKDFWHPPLPGWSTY